MTPFRDSTHAQMLRQMQADGMGYDRLSNRLGYAKATIQHAATGRKRAGKNLQRDIEQLWTEWRASNAAEQGNCNGSQQKVEVARLAGGAR